MLMPTIGITGGVGTGKSSFTEILRELAPRAAFFDADAAARELTTDAAVLQEIRAAFGNVVFDPSGNLNRAALRAMVFADSGRKLDLERILHPRIRQQWRTLAETHRNSSDFFFADIPLLYETGGETLCDLVCVVACSEAVQLDRLMKRTGMSEAEARGIIAAQMPLDEKIVRGNHVIWNNGPRDNLRVAAATLVEHWAQIYG